MFTLIAYILYVTGWIVIFAVMEFKILKRGGKSYQWVTKLYNKFRLDRINW